MSVDIDNRDMLGTQGQHRVGHCRASPTRAKLHDMLSRRVGETPLKAPPKAGPVGVVAGAPALHKDDGVDRTDGARLAGELVEVRHNLLLERVGDVESVEFDQVSGKIGRITITHGFLFHTEVTIPASMIASISDRVTLNVDAETVKSREPRS